MFSPPLSLLMVSIVMAKLSSGDYLEAETWWGNSLNTLNASLNKWEAAIISSLLHTGRGAGILRGGYTLWHACLACSRYFKDKHPEVMYKHNFNKSDTQQILHLQIWMLEWNQLIINSYEEMSFTTATLILSGVIQVEGEPLPLISASRHPTNLIARLGPEIFGTATHRHLHTNTW